METLNNLYQNIGVAGIVLILVAVYGAYLGAKNIVYINLVRKEFRKNYKTALRHRESKNDKKTELTIR